MEEALNLVLQRINAISELNQSFKTSFTKETDGKSNEDQFTNKQFVAHIVNLRYDEKGRSLKENKLFELISNAREYEDPQLSFFHDNSYTIIQKMYPIFRYEKYEHYDPALGIKAVAKIYLRLFQMLGMNNRSDELKKVYGLTKHLKSPVVTFLVKSLMEISRTYFHDSLRKIHAEFLSTRKPNKEHHFAETKYARTEPSEEPCSGLVAFPKK